ncbi:hypothetical protein FRC17_011268 [Serendipita sp. 399]|nr:hypothetical protein FRC17_011268 [Serendipita sp. 399]
MELLKQYCSGQGGYEGCHMLFVEDETKLAPSLLSAALLQLHPAATVAMGGKHQRSQTSNIWTKVDVVTEKRRHYDQVLKKYERLDWVSKLKSHTSCVNAVTFSQKGGRWLASGGDDLRILLWDMHETNISKPSHTFTGPTRNIFELAFTASNSYLLCGGVDSNIRRYDFQRIGISSDPDPIHTFRSHRQSIRGIAPHISNDELYITASEEGRLFYHDARTDAPVGHLVSRQGWVGVQFHPFHSHLFLGATERGRGKITLFDVRKCFGQGIDVDDKEIMRYATQPIGTKPISSSLCDIAFDRTGNIFASVSQGHFPTVYSLTDPYPIAVCTAERLPSGEPVKPTDRTYRNSCTIKHVSFGGPLSSSIPNSLDDAAFSPESDQYLATGSDDFRGYVWRLPSTSYLMAKREEMEDDTHDWSLPKGKYGYILSALDDTLHVPMIIDQPACRLGGHQSIVNTARWHPVLPRIASCGIESKVVLHDCAPVIAGSIETDPSTIRRRARGSWRLRNSRRGPTTDEVDQEISEGEEKDTIEYFDTTLLEEEEEERARRRNAAAVLRGDLSDSSDGLTGGAGGIDEADDMELQLNDRARLMALFLRFLGGGARGDGDEEVSATMTTDQFFRLLRETSVDTDDDPATDDNEGGRDGDNDDDEVDMDMDITE